MHHRRAAPVRSIQAMIAVMLTAAAIAVPSSASAQTCQSLWVERNSYYKAAGYCFKTARAIAYFGNAGCRHDDEASVPLSPAVRARIAEIIRLERRFGCE